MRRWSVSAFFSTALKSCLPSRQDVRPKEIKNREKAKKAIEAEREEESWIGMYMRDRVYTAKFF